MENDKLIELRAEIFNSLTDEQKQRFLACKDGEELRSLLSEMNVALPDEVLNAVSGGHDNGGSGSNDAEPRCRKCGNVPVVKNGLCNSCLIFDMLWKL